MKYLSIYYFIFLVGITCLSLAQQPSTSDRESDPDIASWGVNRGSYAHLRWVATYPDMWDIVRENGLMLERAHYDQNNELGNQKFSSLGLQKMLPESSWPIQSKKDSSLLNAAYQLVFKEMPGDIAGEESEREIRETRWTLLHMLADVSSEVAQALGIAYLDTDFDRDQSYVYRLFCPGYPDIDTAYTVISPHDIQLLMAPELDSVLSGEDNISILWEDNSDFVAYHIERATDSIGPFRQLNVAPFMNLEDESFQDTTGFLSYFDDKVVSNQPYWYRIKGITSFGEISPASNQVLAVVKDITPPPAPVNVKVSYESQELVNISWEYDFPQEKGLEFFILTGDRRDSLPAYTKMNEIGLSAFERSYQGAITNGKGSYFMVTAVDSLGNAAAALPVFSAAADSIAPNPPAGLLGSCDSLGNVLLTWKPNAEKDLKGYRVFWANDSNHVFTQLSDTVFHPHTYADSVGLNSLSEQVYYKVVAVDWNQNHSDFSATLMVKLPDTIPPSAPIFSDYNVRKEGIEVAYFLSKDLDIAYHCLLRSSGEMNQWDTLAVYLPTEKDARKGHFLDVTAEPSITYYYRLVAVDDDGHSTDCPQVLGLQRLAIPKTPSALEVKVKLKKDRIGLEWKLPDTEVAHVLIFKKERDSGFVTYRRLGGEEIAFLDENAQPSNRYQYGIVLEFPSGRRSRMVKSEMISL